jgi:hypothetical protein
VFDFEARAICAKPLSMRSISSCRRAPPSAGAEAGAMSLELYAKRGLLHNNDAHAGDYPGHRTGSGYCAERRGAR